MIGFLCEMCARLELHMWTINPLYLQGWLCAYRVSKTMPHIGIGLLLIRGNFLSYPLALEFLSRLKMLKLLLISFDSFNCDDEFKTPDSWMKCPEELKFYSCFRKFYPIISLVTCGSGAEQVKGCPKKKLLPGVVFSYHCV